MKPQSIRAVHAHLTRLTPIAAAVTILSLSFNAMADVSLPRVFSDGAVLQREKPLHIWGWADEGESVTVSFGKISRTTTAKNGEWSVSLPALKAGGPYTLTVKGNNTIERRDMLMGDVWVAAGQSNIELPIRRVKYHYPGLIESTQLPQVREFNVPLTYALQGPVNDFTQGEWKQAIPEHLPTFSAAGFFFMRAIHADQNVPVGLITLPVGGSPIEAWLSESALASYPHYVKQLAPFKNEQFVADTLARDKANSDQWFAELGKKDLGLQHHWQSPTLNDNDWSTMQLPGFLKTQGRDFTNGAFWIRKTIHLTEEQAAKKGVVWLGCVVDGDQVFVNGESIGQTYYQYPPRIYDVPTSLLKAGENTIAVRVTSYGNNPGFVMDKRYELRLGDGPMGDEGVSLAGEWKFKEAARMGNMAPSTTMHYQPASLFNGKLAPIVPLSVKGVLWYQGESNVERADAPLQQQQPAQHCTHETCAGVRSEYRYLMKDLIADWRTQFNQANLPFIYAQLPEFLPASDVPTDSKWAELREAQRQTLAVKNTAMAITLGSGEWNDIHPLDKQTVGERMALGALKVAYGKKSLVASGPLLQKATRKGQHITLAFSDVGKGLKVDGERLQRLAVAGADKRFVWVEAVVKKDRIEIHADSIPEPHWVRYAWADNPAGANLYNSAGLPASPFEAYLD